MASIIFKETGETIKTFETIEKALEWADHNCSMTLAWLMGDEEGVATYKGEKIDLI